MVKRRTITITLDERAADETFDDAMSQIGDVVTHLRDIGLRNTGIERGEIHEVSFTWDDLSDLDKGSVLMFLHKCEYEGEDYARENYPCVFLEHPELVELTSGEANNFAHGFKDDLESGILDDDDAGTEYQRLYNLALNHGRRPR